MTVVNNSEWKLKDLSIRFQEYGEFKGKYVGQMQFTNREQEAFTFNVSAERTEQLLNLIKDQLVDTASNLGERLLQSLGLLLAAPKKEIGTPIEEIHETVEVK